MNETKSPKLLNFAPAAFVLQIACVIPAIAFVFEQSTGFFDTNYDIAPGPFVRAVINLSALIAISSSLFVRQHSWPIKVAVAFVSLAAFGLFNLLILIGAIVLWAPIAT